MKPVVVWLKLAIVLSAVLFPGLEGSVAQAVGSTDSARPDFCTAPEYREFDFWVGDWEVFDVDNPNRQVARTRVDPILDGCILREDYQDTNGLEGQSFSSYDTSQRIWRQSWMTNRGQTLTIAVTEQRRRSYS